MGGESDGQFDRGLELARRDEIRLDQDIAEQVLSTVLAEGEVQLVRRDQLLIDEHLSEQRARLDLPLEGERPLELALVDQPILDQEPAEKGVPARTGAVGGCLGSAGGAQLCCVHRMLVNRSWPLTEGRPDR